MQTNAGGTACRVGQEAPERTGQRHYPTFQTGFGREPSRQIRVARPTWPCSAATCRRVSARPVCPPKVAFPAHPERRTGRPPQRAGRPFNPDLYCIVAGQTLFKKAGLLSRTGFQPVCLRASSPRHSLSDWAGSPRKERPEALSYFSDRLWAGTMQTDPGSTGDGEAEQGVGFALFPRESVVAEVGRCF